MPEATRRLYRQDPYATRFGATVRSVGGGGREVVLDETLFYPTAGGQQHDTGSLGGVAVVDVRNGDKAIVHVLAEPLEVAPGDTVQGEIDWARRFDHMQQHTGEHILGQAFLRVGYGVVAVAMGAGACTLDLNGSVNTEEMVAAEEIANAAIWAGLPVRWYELPEEDALQLPLRRPPQVSGSIRVVQVGDYDYSACGGTHLRNSAEAGLVKVLGSERVKGGATRIYFKCGRRALQDYRLKHDAITTIARSFSTSEDKVAERVAASVAEASEAKREAAGLRARLAAETLAGLLARAEQVGGVALVAHDLGDPVLLQDLAKLASEQPRLVALLATRGEGALIAVACGPESGLDARELLRTGLEAGGGRGGGKPELARGSLPDAAALPRALEAMHAQALARLAP